MSHPKPHSKSCFCLSFLFVFVWLGLGASPLLATPKFPYLSGHVVDTAGALPSDIKSTLETLLTKHESKTKNQVVVVVLNTLDGYEIADYGYQLGRHWGIGQKDKNNGALLIVALKERQVRIEVGYGLESILTDAKTKSIIEQKIIPCFKQGNINQGIEEGIKSILEAIGGYDSDHEHGFAIYWWLMALIFFAFLFGGKNNNKKGPPRSGGRKFFSSGRSGGGFSGGGGSFGGGGSSGRW